VQLRTWKTSPVRKPLILRGARQTGKTWLLHDFGEAEYKNYAYYNFEEQPELKQFFATSRDVRRIIQNLALATGKPIVAAKTLIIFDEIQECNDALNSLKYFCENAPEYHVVAAGSLLGITLSRGSSFPVGKVDFIDVHPLVFSEFLSAADPDLFSFLESIDIIDLIPDFFFSRLLEQFKRYFISGGMPEAAVALLEKQDMALTQRVLQNILDAYALDFSKHAENKMVPKIGYVWTSIPSQLARENKKFLYQTVKPGARAREYEDAVNWLVQAGLVHKIFRARKPGLPLSAYDDVTAFKLYACDVGLLRRLAQLDPVAIKEGNRLFVEFKGALSENFILQSLVRHFEIMPRYWTSEGKAEVDFIIQTENNIWPVEVKSDENVRSKSLAIYEQQHHPALRIRFSLKNLEYVDGLLNIPLFMADYTKKLITSIFK
jgi:predicted AAA+ superfamily ATPase